MDDSRFGALSRSLTTAGSRRGPVRALGALAAVSLVHGLGLTNAQARKKKKRGKVACPDPVTCPPPVTCPTPERCPPAICCECPEESGGCQVFRGPGSINDCFDLCGIGQMFPGKATRGGAREAAVACTFFGRGECEFVACSGL